MNKKINIFGFNHISPDLTIETKNKLIELYKNYHKLSYCYQLKFKKLSKIKLTLHLTSLFLTGVGTLTGFITLNPIIGGSIAIGGVMIQGYLTTTKIDKSIEKCILAYSTYNQILVELISYLRGMEFDINVLLSDLRVKDEIIIKQKCPSAKKYEKKYFKYYDTNVQNIETLKHTIV